MSLADILEAAASALPDDAESIRPANGDPFQLMDRLGADGASRVLAWVLANEPESGAELAMAWVDVEGGPAVLASLEEGGLPKAGRKALRKALHRLRSRGIALPAKRKAAPVVARLPRIEDDLEAGYVSAHDPRGARRGAGIQVHVGDVDRSTRRVDRSPQPAFAADFFVRFHAGHAARLRSDAGG